MAYTAFIGKESCIRTASILEDVKELDYLEIGQDQLSNAANQFDIAALKGGKYFANIIAKPHFSDNEIDEIATLVPRLKRRPLKK